jgi:hypothetical protein
LFEQFFSGRSSSCKVILISDLQLQVIFYPGCFEVAVLQLPGMMRLEMALWTIGEQ